jgi:hypothetical protein
VSVMADPLSITASIAAVIQLTSTVLKYIIDVNDASADRKTFILEISSTRGILSTLNETVDDARCSDTWSATIRALEDPEGPLNILKTTFQQLATALEGSGSATGIKKTVKSLRWPFKQNEVEKFLRIIERQKSTLSLALENDHVALSREICNNTQAIRDDVAGLSRDFAAAQLDIKADAEASLFTSEVWTVLIVLVSQAKCDPYPASVRRWCFFQRIIPRLRAPMPSSYTSGTPQ